MAKKARKPRKGKSKLKERHVYFYPCAGGHKRLRQSFRKSVAQGGICRECLRKKVNENQLSILDIVEKGREASLVVQPE